jgi:hypothetical protein
MVFPMDWPLASHYTAILQNPKLAFSDPELQGCQIRRDAHNQPLGISGQFAVVYQATFPDGRNKAVRAFTSDREERTERYQQISEYLRQVPDPECLVSFHFHERGIRAISKGRARMYPLVTMEWVSGVTLLDWVRSRCLASESDRLAALANRWVALVAELESARIAHGDLQHGNVMVTASDELRLVDYDGMCVPSLSGRRNLETGMSPYQHPQRNGDTLLDPALDRFSALFIYTGLRALAAMPQVWQDYVESRGYDKLLFRAEDLAYPGVSELYQTLQSSPDPQIPELLELLINAYQGAPDGVPRLGDLVGVAAPEAAAGVGESAASAAVAVGPPPESEADDSWAPGTAAVLTAPAAEPWSPAEPAATANRPAAGLAATASQPPAAGGKRVEPTPGVAPLVIAMQRQDQQTFRDTFDSRIIRQHPGEFGAHQQQLLSWTRDLIRSRERIGLAPTRGRESLTAVPGNGTFQCRWMWPAVRFTENCVVGLSRRTVSDDDSPENLTLEMQRTVSRQIYESGRGLTIHADRKAAGCQVVVWALIELGFAVVYSQPLTLGVLRLGPGVDSGRKRSW